MKWSRLSNDKLWQCPYFSLYHDRYHQPDDRIGDYYYLHLVGSAMIVPVHPDGKLTMVRQHRYLMNKLSLEFPAGGMRADETPILTAQKELREETGFEAKQWQKIGEYAPCNGLSNEICHVFLAKELNQVGSSPEPTEEIEVVSLSEDEIEDKIRSGEIWDGMTLASLQLHRTKR